MIMKKILLSLISGVAISLTAQVTIPKDILFPLDLVVTKIDTASVSRGATRVYITVYQYAKCDPSVQKELLRRFSELSSSNVSGIEELKYRIGCDCETNDLKVFDIYHKFNTEEGPRSIMSIGGPTIIWSKTILSEEEYGYNDTEKQLIKSLCSRFTYKVDSLSHDLLIEEIPSFLRENPKTRLQNVARMSLECELPYKPFKEFNSDTTAFLRYNFKDRAICYRGKKVSQLLKDLQLTPRRFTTLSSTRVNKYEGIFIYVDNTTIHDVLQNPGRKTQKIYIYWPDLMDSTELTKLRRTYDNGGAWIQQYYDFFKNMVVGEVKYYK